MAPKIDRRSLKNVSVREGESFVVDVKIIGEPAPEVTWTIGTKPIAQSHSRRVEDVPYNSKYFNDKPERKDTGTYTITAVNKYGQDSADVEIAVICKLNKAEGRSHILNIFCVKNLQRNLESQRVLSKYMIFTRKDVSSNGRSQKTMVAHRSITTLLKSSMLILVCGYRWTELKT